MMEEIDIESRITELEDRDLSNDFYHKIEMDGLLEEKVNVADWNEHYYTSDDVDDSFYTKGNVNALLEDKANVVDLDNFYTKGNVDTIIGNYYTTNEVDTIIGNYYTTNEVDTKPEDVTNFTTIQETSDAVAIDNKLQIKQLNDLEFLRNDEEESVAAFIKSNFEGLEIGEGRDYDKLNKDIYIILWSIEQVIQIRSNPLAHFIFLF